MRLEDIRFKAKRLDNKQWVEGNLITNGDRAYIVDRFKSMSDYSVIGVDPSTVCQYTGLKDSKGQEIWEHDLIHFVGYEPTAEVRWVEDAYGFMVEHDGELDWLSEILEIGKIERICSKFDKEV